MDFIVKNEFSKQLNNLFKKYNLILNDFEDFKINFNIKNGNHLGKGIYKFRIKNSSIPVGKSGGFRVILLIHIVKNKALPFIIYSKTEIENITLNNILIELRKYL